MKRSEMIELLGQLIYDNQHFDGHHDDKILEGLLKAGMLPPPIKTDVVNSKIVYCYYPEVVGLDKNDNLDLENSVLWESEND